MHTRKNLLLVLSLLWLCPTFLFANSLDTLDQSLACYDGVSIWFDTNCEPNYEIYDLIELDSTASDCSNFELEFWDGPLMFSELNSEHVKDTLVVKVINTDNQNACWGSIYLFDSIPPIVSCDTVIIQCYEDFETVAPPTVWDNCEANPNLQMTGQTINSEFQCNGHPTFPNGVIIVERTWRANDISGNLSNFCSQIIYIERTPVDLPGEDITRSWEAYVAHPSILDPIPLTNDLATTGAGAVFPNAITACDLNIHYNDDTLQACGNDFKIIRTWTVLDFCTGQTIQQDADGDDNVQIIRVEDSEGPVFEPYSLTLTEDCNQCFPPIEVSDEWNEITDLRIFTPIGELQYENGENGLNGGCVPLPNLPAGNHVITYLAEDACGNETEIQVPITVNEDTMPIADCTTDLEVVLDENGMAEMSVLDINKESYAPCDFENIEIKRLETDCVNGSTDFTENVQFCCNDAGQNIDILLRINTSNNDFAECATSVLVLDTTSPQITFCPVDTIVTCEDDISDLSVFGDALFVDNCLMNIDYNVDENVHQSCGTGTIVRTWEATDGQNENATCTQIVDVGPFNDWYVTFPPNRHMTCAEYDALTDDFPQLFNDDCELIAVNFEDQIFDIVPDACYKIIRTYTIIDWCVFDGDNLDDGEEIAERTFTAGEDGIISYLQTIKLLDNTPPIVEVELNEFCVDANCEAAINLPIPNIIDCTQNDNVTIQVSVAQNGIPYSFGYNMPDTPPGIYEITYTATDNCGNTTEETMDLFVEDCAPPVPFCIGGLTVELDATGVYNLNVTELDAGSYDACTNVSFFSNENLTQTMHTFNCEHLGSNMVKLWVADTQGNAQSCTTTVIIQQNPGVDCSGGINPSISGQVTTENGTPVAGVEVGAGNLSSGVPTNTSGDYTLYNTTANQDYFIQCEKNYDWLAGVTAFDLVVIRRHILGLESIDSPYKLIGADVNNSGSITTADIVQLKQLLTFQIDELPNNESWRFIDASYEFSNPSDPWEVILPEYIYVPDLQENTEGIDFIGIKIGDVN